MFADDTKLYSTIKCEEDAMLHQSDLQSLEQWSITSGLNLVPRLFTYARRCRKDPGCGWSREPPDFRGKSN